MLSNTSAGIFNKIDVEAFLLTLLLSVTFYHVSEDKPFNSHGFYSSAIGCLYRLLLTRLP